FDDTQPIAKLTQSVQQIHVLDKSPRSVDTGFQILGRHITINRRQETRISTFLHGNEVHILELPCVSVWTDLLEYTAENVSQRGAWVGDEFIQAESSNEYT